LKIKLRRKKINEIVKVSKGVLPIMAYKRRLCPKQGAFFRFQVYKRVGISQNGMERSKGLDLGVEPPPLKFLRVPPPPPLPPPPWDPNTVMIVTFIVQT